MAGLLPMRYTNEVVKHLLHIFKMATETLEEDLFSVFENKDDSCGKTAAGSSLTNITNKRPVLAINDQDETVGESAESSSRKRQKFDDPDFE